jgi:8-oxo-dGTP diphosphatase
MSDQLEVHVGVICFKKDKVLILKRSPERRLYPNLWECGGGKVRPGESFIDACKREMKEEAGIEIEYIDIVKIYQILLNKNYKIPGVVFAFKVNSFLDGGKPKISEEHTEYKFISEDEINDYDFIKGIKDDIKQAYEVMRRNREIK